MLSQTKENIQDIVNKLQVLDFVLDTLGRTHKDELVRVEGLLKVASTHKIKLVEEILRLSVGSNLEVK